MLEASCSLRLSATMYKVQTTLPTWTISAEVAEAELAFRTNTNEDLAVISPIPENAVLKTLTLVWIPTKRDG